LYHFAGLLGVALWRTSRAERQLQIIRQRAVKLKRLAAKRVLEGKPRGMQKLPIKAKFTRTTVQRVTRHRMANCQKVRPDLVSAARLQTQPQKRMRRHALKHLKVGYCGARLICVG
jgi:hypothetical protein